MPPEQVEQTVLETVASEGLCGEENGGPAGHDRDGGKLQVGICLKWVET